MQAQRALQALQGLQDQLVLIAQFLVQRVLQALQGPMEPQERLVLQALLEQQEI